MFVSSELPIRCDYSIGAHSYLVFYGILKKKKRKYVRGVDKVKKIKNVYLSKILPSFTLDFDDITE